MGVRGETEMHLSGGESSPNPHMLSLVSESFTFSSLKRVWRLFISRCDGKLE